MLDLLNRPLRNLRLSVTDRCNLRCEYCMPEDDYVWLPREDVLKFEETSALVDVFIALGVDKVRLTGGEPLLRRDLPSLVRMLAVKPGLGDLALTTNGVLLADQIDALKSAGLGRVTVSLDTLRSDRFLRLTRFDELSRVKDGIEAAKRAFGTLKIDSVVIRGVNDDELVDLVEYGKSVDAEVRFIEYMDVGGATRWSPDRVMSRQQILDVFTHRYGAIQQANDRSASAAGAIHAPADLPPARRHDVRHHFVDARPVLPDLRPGPPHRRRDVVPLSVRVAGHRSPGCAATRRQRGRVESVNRGGMADPRRPRGGNAPGSRRAALVRGREHVEKRSAPRNAYAGGVTVCAGLESCATKTPALRPLAPRQATAPEHLTDRTGRTATTRSPEPGL